MGIPAIELTEPAIPGHLGQVAGFTSSDRNGVHLPLRHENEKTVRQTNNQKTPQGELRFINHLPKTIGRKPLLQTKASCPQLGETADIIDQIRLLPQREQQKGAKATTTTWQAGGHGQRTSQDFL